MHRIKTSTILPCVIVTQVNLTSIIQPNPILFFYLANREPQCFSDNTMQPITTQTHKEARTHTSCSNSSQGRFQHKHKAIRAHGNRNEQYKCIVIILKLLKFRNRIILFMRINATDEVINDMKIHK